jgi:hypothetical protein
MGTSSSLPVDKQARRLAGEAQCAQAKVPTYQELLDEALENTFPASDPVATSVAMHVHEPRLSERDAKDWTLAPGACGPVGQRTEAMPVPIGRAAAHVIHPFEWNDGAQRSVTVPAGPCTIEQTDEAALLRWKQDGSSRSLSMRLQELQALLTDGRIERDELE